MSTPAEALFGRKDIKWVLVDEHLEKRAVQLRRKLIATVTSEQFDECINHIIKYYLDEKLNGFRGISLIKIYFEEARKRGDVHCILTAYTLDTDFFRILNIDLATDHLAEKRDNLDYQISRTYILVLLLNDFQMNDKLKFRGECYRGLGMNEKDFKQYEKGQKVLFKAFQSTSSIRANAEKFAQPKLDQLKALFKFSIKYSPTAIKIEKHSQFEHEEEVLIYPYSLFEIKESYIKSDGSIYIELHECKTEMTNV